MNPETESEQSSEYAQIVIRPPSLFLGGLTVASILELVYPLGPGLAQGTKRPVFIGLGIAAIGLAFGWRAIQRFADAGTHIAFDEPTETLVKSGLYALSRNPIYIGLITVYFGLALALTSVWALLLLPFLVHFLQKGVIAPEEKFLEDKFGERYLAYKQKVPRWL